MPNLFRHLYLFCSIETPNQVRGDTVRFPLFILMQSNRKSILLGAEHKIDFHVNWLAFPKKDKK